MKRIAGVAALVAAGAGLLILLALPAREPVYQGKTLSQWLEPGDGPGQYYLTPSMMKEVTAIQAMGSNAVPSLIGMLRCKDSSFRTKWVAWVAKHGWLKSKIELRPPAEEMRRRGLIGVLALGPIARDATPDVIALLTNQNPGWQRGTALNALEKIGEQKMTVPALLEILKDPDPWLRVTAANVLNRLAWTPEAIPPLIKYLDDPDVSVRETVLRVLQALAQKPKLTAEMAQCLKDHDAGVRAEVMGFRFYVTNAPSVLVSVLSIRLRDGNSFVRSMAAFHLGEIGTNAAPSVPALRELSRDPVSNVCEAATNALWEIAGLGAEPAAVNEKASITLNFPAMPLDQIIEIYEGWAGHRLVRSMNVAPSSPIRLQILHPVNRIEALKLIEEAMGQAHLAIKNGHLTLAAMEIGDKSR